MINYLPLLSLSLKLRLSFGWVISSIRYCTTLSHSQAFSEEIVVTEEMLLCYPLKMVQPQTGSVSISKPFIKWFLWRSLYCCWVVIALKTELKAIKVFFLLSFIFCYNVVSILDEKVKIIDRKYYGNILNLLYILTFYFR